MAKKKERSAGFIIVRKETDGWRVLGLRVYGKIDIPKGHVEPGESDIGAAFRECKEEAGIDVALSDMRWGQAPKILERSHKDVIIFLASTDQEPVILPNPETNRYEHEGFHWLTWEVMKQRCYPYLVPAIQWAQERVEGAS
jgi:bis(5'-nucleosidyl)-tetraphosphatase